MRSPVSVHLRVALSGAHLLAGGPPRQEGALGVTSAWHIDSGYNLVRAILKLYSMCRTRHSFRLAHWAGQWVGEALGELAN